MICDKKKRKRKGNWRDDVNYNRGEREVILREKKNNGPKIRHHSEGEKVLQHVQDEQKRRRMTTVV